jgi:cytochrome c-type biogenesis protein CcmH
MMISQRITRTLLIFGLLAVSPGLLLAASIAEDPKERKMLQIAQKLRCAVCQNQPVSESNSGLARDMRVIIREQLAAGKNEEQIIDYFVARYGDYVLLKPRKRGTGFALWILPPLLLVFAGGFAWQVMRGRAHATTTHDSSQSALSDEDRERIRRARKQHDEEDK